MGFTTLNTYSHSLKLHKVLHVPHIVEDLLSVKQLCKDNRCWFICDDNWFFEQDKVTKEIFCKGKSRPDELFQIPVFKPLSSLTQFSACTSWIANKVISLASAIGTSYK